MQYKLLLLFLIFSPFLIHAQRSLNIGLSSGFTQFYSEDGGAGNNEIAGATANPIFSAPFRYISVSAQLGLTEATAVSLDLGYNKMVGGVSMTNPKWGIPVSINPVLLQSLFLEPGMAYSFALDKYFHIVTSLSSAVHFNVSGGDKAAVRGSFFGGDITTDLQLKQRMPVFITVNPGVEFRSLATETLRIGFLIKYLQGLGTIAHYGGSVSHNENPQEFDASYKGTGILLALRLSYCLPCSN